MDEDIDVNADLQSHLKEQYEEGLPEEMGDPEENTAFGKKINAILDRLSKLPDSVESIKVPKVSKDAAHIYSKLCKALSVPESSEFLSNVNNESMDFSYHCLGPVGIIAVTKALTYCKSVKILNLSFNELGSESLPAITSLLNQNEFVTNLTLSNNSIGKNSAKLLSDLVSVSHSITHLDLSGNSLGDEEFGSIATPLAKIDSIKILNLRKNDIGASSGDLFGSNLAKCSALEQLDLSDNHLGNGIVKIFRSLKNSNLRVLNVSKNRIPDEPMQGAAFGIRNSKSLQKLDLSFNFISNKGATSLASGVKKSSTLEILKLDHNPIEDSGANILLRAAGNSLKILDLTGIKVSLSFMKTYRSKCKNEQELKVVFGSEIRYDCFPRDEFVLDIDEDSIDESNALLVAQKLADEKGVSLRKVFRNIHASFLTEQAAIVEEQDEIESEEDKNKIVRKMTTKDFSKRLTDSSLEIKKSLAQKLSASLSDNEGFVDMWEIIPKILYRPDDLAIRIKVKKNEQQDKQSKKKEKKKK